MAVSQLSAQLKKLQTPQTDLFLEKRTKSSIIFSANDAAKCNKETFYKIGKFILM